jgi:hypothetical protein
LFLRLRLIQVYFYPLLHPGDFKVVDDAHPLPDDRYNALLDPDWIPWILRFLCFPWFLRFLWFLRFWLHTTRPLRYLPKLYARPIFSVFPTVRVESASRLSRVGMSFFVYPVYTSTIDAVLHLG